MWSYYGSKTNLVSLYPDPVYDTIIEPFAGAAKYSLKHFDKRVILIDKYPVIINLWRWLQKCSEKDILSLPRYLPLGKTVDDINWDCQEAKDFFGFMIACADARPKKSAGKRKAIDRPNFTNFGIKRVAADLYKIRHWEFILGDYTDSPDIPATWFIDPPYQFGGHVYPMSSKKIDFDNLAQWCKGRQGQLMVCENTKATWLPFLPMKAQRGSLFTTTEAIYTNYHTHYNNVQQSIVF
jgi:hypothetical protein